MMAGRAGRSLTRMMEGAGGEGMRMNASNFRQTGDMNYVRIIGNVGTAPAMRSFTINRDGQELPRSVCRFSVCTMPYVVPGTLNGKKSWHQVDVFGAKGMWVFDNVKVG